MLGALDHPRILYDWFTTALLRWADGGLVIYDQWLINFSGVSAWQYTGNNNGEVLLDFYYLCYLLAFIGVIILFDRFRKSGWIKIKPHVSYDALILAMIGVLVGAKTAYIFIYNPEFYFGDPPYGPVNTADQLRRIFLNWSGMASHGAVTGIVLAGFIWWLRARPPIAHIGDIGCMSGALGAIWIRLANFMNGELYGRAADPGLPWAMRFEVRSGKGLKVLQNNGELYERVPKPDDPALLEPWLKAMHEANPGKVQDWGDGSQYVYLKNPDAYLQGYEVVLQPGPAIETCAPNAVPQALQSAWLELVTTPRHPSQIYQLLLEGLLLFLFLLWLRPRVKRAGMVAGAFFAGYALARFIGEFWRQPDVQFQKHGNELGTVFFGLSMGQCLSLVLFSFGVAFFLYFRSRGQVIADMKMWPPDPPEEATQPTPVELGTGGSSAAGDLAGLTEVREALHKKQAEWDAEAEKDKP